MSPTNKICTNLENGHNHNEIKKQSAIDKITAAKYLNDAIANYFNDGAGINFRLLKLEEGNNKKVLYILCEDGKYFMEKVKPNFPPSFQDFVAVDYSTQYINKANNLFQDPDVSFRSLDIETTDLNWKEKYDYVMSFWKMHLVNDRLQTFKNIYSLLNPGGCTFLAYVVDSQFIKTFRRLSAKKFWSRYLYNNLHLNYLCPSQSHDFDDIHADLKRAGFVNIKFERSKVSNLFMTENEYKEKFDLWNVFRCNIPTNYQNLFYLAFLDDMRTESRLVFGDYSFTDIFLAVDNVVVNMIAYKPVPESNEQKKMEIVRM